MRSILCLSTVLLTTMLACAPPAVPYGTSSDSGASVDGGAADSGEADGGAADGGSADGGTADGGTADGGSADGAATDGGSSDGGAADGGADGGEEQTSPPTIQILFPATDPDLVVCPTFVMVVDIDGLDIVDYHDNPDPVDGQGHWHVYDSGSYLAAFTEAWGVVTIDNDGTPSPHSITATLSGNDHSALGVESTVEITVGPEGCVGGDVPDDGADSIDTSDGDTGSGTLSSGDTG